MRFWGHISILLAVIYEGAASLVGEEKNYFLAKGGVLALIAVAFYIGDFTKK